jgi:hypothetical protein
METTGKHKKICGKHPANITTWDIKNATGRITLKTNRV